MPSPPLSPLSTARLALWPLRKGDAAEMVGILANNQLYEFTGGDPPELVELERRFQAWVEGPPDPSEQWHNWIVRLVDSGRAVGFVQATVQGATAEIAWLIGTEHQRRGFATEAAQMMCDRLKALGVGSFTAHIHPQHLASQKVAARLGLAPTGGIDGDGEAIWASGEV